VTEEFRRPIKRGEHSKQIARRINKKSGRPNWDGRFVFCAVKSIAGGAPG
jgi:hypothetical protein